MKGSKGDAGPRSCPIHTRLRRSTAELHQAVEAQLDLLDDNLSLERYVRVLGALHGFYAPLEERLEPLFEEEMAAGLSFRRRAPRIEQDLSALGVSAGSLTTLARCLVLPEVTTLGQLAGCSYVIEGASLGGQIITRHLGAHLGLTAACGATFFHGDGAETPARWRRFLDWLGELPSVGVDEDEILGSARATFAALHRWLERSGAGSRDDGPRSHKL